MTISLADQIACVERELAMRRRVFPAWIARGRMTEANARKEIHLSEQAILVQLARWKFGVRFIQQEPQLWYLRIYFAAWVFIALRVDGREEHKAIAKEDGR